jgi:RNA polymerase-interacting CarD/CdnL/TRCF family regulator
VFLASLVLTYILNNLRNVRREASRHFRNKKREYLQDKIAEIELNSKNKIIRDLYRDITEFKKGYQPKSNLVKVREAIFLQILKKF